MELQRLLNEGLSPDAMLNDWLLTQCAVKYDRMSMLGMLFKYGARINRQNSKGYSALSNAVASNNHEVVKLLLNQIGIQVNLKDIHDVTPLIIACYYGYKIIAELLLNKGANVNVQEKHGLSPLHYAVRYNHTRVVKLLLDQDDIEVDVRGGRHGLTALYNACSNGYKTIAELLLKKGADVNALGNTGYSPLHITVANLQYDVVKLLLDRVDIEVNLQQNPPGYSPLHIAAQNGDVEMIKLLVETGGADTSLRSKSGKTPLQIAEKYGNVDAAYLLRHLG